MTAEKLLNMIEPEAADPSHSHFTPSDAALFSIAISLKRIADEISGADRLGLMDSLWEMHHASKRKD